MQGIFRLLAIVIGSVLSIPMIIGFYRYPVLQAIVAGLVIICVLVLAGSWLWTRGK